MYLLAFSVVMNIQLFKQLVGSNWSVDDLWLLLTHLSDDCMFLYFTERPVISPEVHNVSLGDNITFTCREFGSPPFTYLWFMIDTPTGDVRLLENENNSDYNIASVLYNHTGEYVCEASNEMGVFSNSTPARLIGENILTL